MQENWYADTLCKVHYDMHTPATVLDVGRDFDAPAFARQLKEMGAEAVDFFARCAYGWSYYPTQIGLPHPHLTRDLFGEGARALRAEGIRVVAYVAISALPAPMAAAHPEWVVVGPEGAPRPESISQSPATCPTRFIEEHLAPQFRELVEHYDVDGFFLDGVYGYFDRPCYCEACRREFGRDIPREPDDPAWAEWRHWQTERVWRRLANAAAQVTALKQDCLLGVNWMGGQFWCVPAPREIGYLTGDPPMQNCTFETSYQLAAWAWRDAPADLMTERMLINWQDFTCRTPESIAADYAAGLAGGGKLYIGDLLRPVDVRPDPEVSGLLRTTFDFARERATLTQGTQPQADIAILASPETVRGRGARWRVDEAPLRGAFLALAEDGLAAHILYDADLEEHLSRYQTLVVPEQRYIGLPAARAIRRFVEGGGSLVVTGAIPQAVEPGAPTATAGSALLAELAGLADEGEHDLPLSYLCLRGTEAEGLWRSGDPFRPPVPAPGRPAKVRPTTARALAPLTAPGPAYQLGAFPPGEALPWPALTENRYGRGTVLFLALPIAADIWTRGNPGARYILQQLVRRATPGLSFERQGAAAVSITRAEAPGRTVLHLVAFQPDARIQGPRVVERPGTLTGTRVRLRDPRRPVVVHAEPGATPLTPEREGEWWAVEVPPFSIHTAVVFDW